MRKRKKNNASFGRLLRYMASHRSAMARIVVFLVASTVFDIFAPRLIARITDSLQFSFTEGAGVDFLAIGNLLIGLGALYILSGFCLYLSKRLLVRVSQQTVCSMRQDIQKKLEVLPLSYLDAHPRGDVLSRATSDIVTLNSTLETNLSQMITKVATIAGTIIMMLVTNWRLSLIFFILLPASMLSIRLITKATQKLFRKQQEALGELNSHMEEMTSGHEVMRAFGHEEAAAEEMEAVNRRFFKTYLTSRTLSGLISPIVKLLNNLVYIAVCVFGGMSILNGGLTLGGLTAFLVYANNISGPISQFSMQLNQLQGGLAAAERIFNLLDVEEETPDAADGQLAVQDVQGAVEFSHVQFGYSREKMLMHDVNFSVKPGEVFAIVGPSGAGKTTLVNLLMRFYEINGGAIRLDGREIDDVSRRDLRSCMGMVLQDTWIFSGTIYDNIAYGLEGATREQVVAAAEQAQCDSFINQLPNGYETHIDEGTSTLSVGEKQLLSIARTVISQPKILILDEATSNIDTRTEVLITRAMRRMMEGRTTFIIAHRLFTIRHADAIIFMKDGDILEVGNHEQLMAKGGHYAEMYNSSSD